MGGWETARRKTARRSRAREGASAAAESSHVPCSRSTKTSARTLTCLFPAPTRLPMARSRSLRLVGRSEFDLNPTVIESTCAKPLEIEELDPQRHR